MDKWKVISFTALVLSIISVSISVSNMIFPVVIQDSQDVSIKDSVHFEIIDAVNYTFDSEYKCYMVTVKYVGNISLMGDVRIITEGKLGNESFYDVVELSNLLGEETGHIRSQEDFRVFMFGDNPVMRIVWETSEETKEEILTLEGIEIKNGLEEGSSV